MAKSLMVYWGRALSVVPAANRPTSARTVDNQWFDVHLKRFDGSNLIGIVIGHKTRSDLDYANHHLNPKGLRRVATSLST